MRPRLVLISALASYIGFSFATPAFSAAPTFQGLGDLPGGAFFSTAGGLSPDGRFVVGSSGVNGGRDAFLWQNGTMTSIGRLPGYATGSATDVSADGTVIVGFNLNGPTPSEGFRWESGVIAGLGFLPNAITPSSAASGVSNDGSIVSGFAGGVGDLTEAFRWQGGVTTRLGVLPGAVSESAAFGISASGAVLVGESRNANGNMEAIRLENGVMTGLGDLAGGKFYGQAFGVSADSSIVVGSSSSSLSGPDMREAFRWENGVMIGLGDLPGGPFWSQANDVSADGLVIVGAGNVKAGELMEAFIWTPVAGMQNLRELLTTDFGLDLTGWRLQEATGISDDGLTIVGYGVNPDGNTEGWIVTIPEPASLSLLALGALFLSRRRT